MKFEIISELKNETNLGPKTCYSLLVESEKAIPETFHKFLIHKKLTAKPRLQVCFEKEQLSDSFFSLGYVFRTNDKYAALNWTRKFVSSLSLKPGYKIYLDLRQIPQATSFWLSCLIPAITAQLFEMPHYKKKKKPKIELQFFLVLPNDKNNEWSKQITALSIEAEANNVVRSLAVLPSNHLTPTAYKKVIEDKARDNKLTLKFFDFKELKKMGAGAFTAVAQGCPDPHRGIYHLKYSPPKAQGKVCFVGKGITFDTGGHNLKVGPHMFGMHEDMTGSALALALIEYAAKSQWPYEVHSFLAITDNLIGPESFRPNDIVKTLSGLTVEVVDTDAEGRMVLADTLTLACKEKPNLLFDFATLTGSCIRAIGTSYSGVFANKIKLYSLAKKASKRSGERVWPFPNHREYKKILKSSLADIKQCRLTGGPDHIEAFQFLNTFVDKNIPYLHIDLSAAHHDGGLAHVPTKTTGFGVHFAIAATELFFKK